MGRKFGSSVVLLSSGCRNFQPYIRTPKKASPPPHYCPLWIHIESIRITNQKGLSEEMEGEENKMVTKIGPPEPEIESGIESRSYETQQI